MATTKPQAGAKKPRTTIVGEAAKPTASHALLTQQDEVKKAEEALAADTKVIVFAPKAFTLILDGHVELPIPAGVQEMPTSVADHWFVKGMGVTVHNPNKQPE